MKSRIAHLDAARGIGILLVILGHMPTVVPAVIRTWIYSFHMPLFLLISGCFAEEITSRPKLRRAIRKKAVGLLIPYFSFSWIFFLIEYLLFQETREQAVRELLIIVQGQAGVQWFLFMLFGISVLFLEIRRICSVKLLIVPGAVFSAFAVFMHRYGWSNSFNIGSILYGFGFYAIGYVFRSSPQLQAILMEGKRKRYILLASSCSSVLLSWLIINRFHCPVLLDMKQNSMIDIVLNYLLALFGSIAVILTADYLVRRCKYIGAALNYVGRHSLYFFIFTWYIPNLVGKCGKNGLVWKAGGYALAIAVAAAASLWHDRRKHT